MRPTGGTGESIRVGVCGLGFIGPVHVEILRRIQHVTVNAVSSTEPGRAEAIAARFAIPRICTNHEDLIADPAIAAAHIWTTNQTHPPPPKRPIDAGKHAGRQTPPPTTARPA